MSNNTKIADIYNVIAEVLDEPWDYGMYPGLSLGIVTLSQVIQLIGLCIEDFVSRTGLVYSIFTQQLLAGTSQYDVPESMNLVKEAFLGGQHISHADLFQLDQWAYNWRAISDIPTYWHQDGLPPKTVEVAANPNYNGASYLAPVNFTGTVDTAGNIATWVSGNEFLTSWNNYTPAPTITINAVDYTLSSVTSNLTLEVDPSMPLGTQSAVAYSITIPSAPPPYGIFGLFNGSTVGLFTGTMTVTGTAGTWATGSLFDLNWNNYYPAPNISLSTDQVTYVAWPIQDVTDITDLIFAVAPGDGTYYWKVMIPNDGNLTLVGSRGLPSVAYTLDSVIPDAIPDSFTPALIYGVLARIFSGDSEARDLQRAAYCQARYFEFANAGASVSGMMAEIG